MPKEEAGDPASPGHVRLRGGASDRRLKRYASAVVGAVLVLSSVCLAVAALLAPRARTPDGDEAAQSESRAAPSDEAAPAREGGTGTGPEDGAPTPAAPPDGAASRQPDLVAIIAHVRRLVSEGDSAGAIRLLDEFSRSQAGRAEVRSLPAPDPGSLSVADIVEPHIKAREAKDVLDHYASEPAAGGFVEKAESLWGRAEAAVAAEDWAAALTAYKEFAKECAGLGPRMKELDGLREARTKALQARKEVEELAGHGAVTGAWKAAEDLVRRARSLEEAGDSSGAGRCYAEAKERFAALGALLAPFRKCRWAATQARRARSLSLRLSCHAASDHWLAEKAYRAAAELELDGRFDEAAEAYAKARAAFETHLEAALKQSPAGLRVIGDLVKTAGPEELAHAPDGVLRKMLNDLPPGAAGHVLRAQESARAVDLLKALPPERRAEVFPTLPVERRDELLRDLVSRLPPSEAEYLAGRLVKEKPSPDLSYLLDLVTKRKVSFGDAPNGAMSLAFSPDGRILAVGHGPLSTTRTGSKGVRSCTVSLWDVCAGKRLRRLTFRRDGYVERVAYSPDGRHLATLCVYTLYRSDGYSVTGRGVQLWDAEKGEIAVWGVGKEALGGTEQGTPTCIAFSPPFDVLRTATLSLSKVSPGAPVLAVGASAGAIALWDVEKRRTVRTLEGQAHAVTDLAFFLDGSRLASADSGARPAGAGARKSEDGTIALWNAATGERLSVLKGSFLAISPSGSRLAVRSTENVVSLLDTGTGKEAGRLAVGAAGGSGLRGPAAFSPDGRLLCLCDDQDAVRVYDVPSGGLVSTITDEGASPHTLKERPAGASGAESMAFSPDGRWLAIGYASGPNVCLRLLPESISPQDVP